MVWPITGAESYVCETGKSTKSMGLAVSQKDWWRNIPITVRRDSAVKLIDGLAGEGPASARCRVGTVVISGDGAGDQTVGSPDVTVLDGWTQRYHYHLLRHGIETPSGVNLGFGDITTTRSYCGQ